MSVRVILDIPDEIAAQPIFRGINCELAILVTVETKICREPEAAAPILTDCQHDQTGQIFISRIGRKFAILVTGQPALHAN